MEDKHRHRAEEWAMYNWTRCINPDICNTRGYGDRYHGKLTIWERCPCSAYRYLERGPGGQIATPWALPVAISIAMGDREPKDALFICDVSGRTATIYADRSAFDFAGRPYERYADMLAHWRGGPRATVTVITKYISDDLAKEVADRLGEIYEINTNETTKVS